jgi:beta-glucosidase
MKATAGKGVEVTHSIDGAGIKRGDVAIAVVGELPYAEGVGDRADLSLTKDDIALVGHLKRLASSVVVLVLSGRPMILGPVLDMADAVVAAWLPGTEGQGVADVLFGAVPPKGKLGRTWPKTTAQEPINIGDEHYDPLFPYGFGLTYS